MEGLQPVAALERRLALRRAYLEQIAAREEAALLEAHVYYLVSKRNDKNSWKKIAEVNRQNTRGVLLAMYQLGRAVTAAEIAAHLPPERSYRGEVCGGLKRLEGKGIVVKAGYEAKGRVRRVYWRLARRSMCARILNQSP